MIYRELPEITESFFKLKSAGGYYEGIKGKPGLFEGSGLNNCTCAAWGLFAKTENNPACRVGCGTRTTATPYDASKWYELTQDGYKRSQTPEEGSIICYKNHVAFVNEILDNGDLVIIESGYGAKNQNGLWTKTVKASENYYRGKIYGDFVGFILPKKQPAKQPEIALEDAIERIAREVLKGTYGNGEARKNALYKAIQGKVNELCRN